DVVVVVVVVVDVVVVVVVVVDVVVVVVVEVVVVVVVEVVDVVVVDVVVVVEVVVVVVVSATVIATLALAESPGRAVARAVIVWGPSESVVTASGVPWPSAPSRSDDHSTAPPRSPLSVSVAVAVNTMGVPATVSPSRGRVIVTTGGVLLRVV